MGLEPSRSVTGGVLDDVRARLPLNLVAIVVLAQLAGCGSEAPTPGRPSPATPSATVSQTQSPSPSSSIAPSAPPPVGDLLPDELDGVELHTFAVGQDVIDRLVTRLGITQPDLEAAYASEHGARFLQMYAIRVPAIEGPSVLDAFVASAYGPGEGNVTVAEQAVGGKPVTVVAQPATVARLGAFYATVTGDTLLVVQAFDPNVAADALAALP